jgi:hypothetical protein
MSKKVKKYKVWIHLEGLDAQGDCIEGDDHHAPEEAGCFTTLLEAESLRAFLLGKCENNHDDDRDGLEGTLPPKPPWFYPTDD